MRWPGIAEVEAKLEAQNAATAQHREWEGQRLRSIETTVDATQALAQATNSRVDQHDIDIAVIKKAEEQALVVQAARQKAEEETRNQRISLKQGLTIGLGSAVVGGAFAIGAALLAGAH